MKAKKSTDLGRVRSWDKKLSMLCLGLPRMNGIKGKKQQIIYSKPYSWHSKHLSELGNTPTFFKDIKAPFCLVWFLTFLIPTDSDFTTQTNKGLVVCKNDALTAFFDQLLR